MTEEATGGEAAADSSTESAEQTQEETTEETASQEQSTEQTQEETTEETAEVKAEMIKKLLLKIDGEEVEETLPFEIPKEQEEFFRKQLQLAKVSQKRMNETAQVSKNYDDFMTKMKDNPWAALEELGLDPDEIAEKRIEERIAELEKSPEQLEKEKQQREIEELREQLKNEKEAKDSAESLRLQEQAAVQLDDEVTEALSATSSLPKTPYVVKRIADTMLWAIDKGFDVKAADVIPTVEKEIGEEIQEMLANIPEEFLYKLIGKQNMEKMRQSRLKNMETKPKIPDTGSSTRKENGKVKEKLRMNDFLRGSLT